MKQLITTLFCALAITVGAQNKPLIKAFSETGFIFGKMSDNGRWVTQYQEVDPTKSPQLIDLSTYKAIDLQSTADINAHGHAVTIDVTNDGNIVVGSHDGKPAYLNRATNKWTALSTKAGCIQAVTPDGHYAVGSTNNSGIDENGNEIVWYTEETPHLWDLTTDTELTLPTLPTVDPKGNGGGLTRFVEISADGRYLLGSMFVDYPDYAFVVNREEGTFRFIGYKQVDTEGKRFDCTLPYMYFISPRSMSSNGQWVVCNGYFVTDTDEFYAPVRHNLLTGETVAYNTTTDDQDMYANVIDNNGNIFGGTPTGSPIREYYIRSGKYWYSLRSVLQQRYGMNFTSVSGLDNTGTPYSISDDGLTLTSMVDPQFGQNYVMKMSEDIVEVCNGLNLLGVYSISPSSGSEFTTLSQIRVTFDRDIEVVGAQTAAKFGTWNSLSGNGIYVDPTDSRTVIVAFRNRVLEGGKKYEFLIPAGTISIKGDRERTNEDITATFTGRANQPVKVLSIYPADGSTIAKIDNSSSSPVILTMDCEVVVDDNAEAWLETAADQRRICDLLVAYNGNQVALFPATTQYLYKDIEYRVVMKAGHVTDVMGGGATSEDLHIQYFGSFERETTQASGTLFADDFNNISNSLAQWLLYDGDHRTPTEEMQAMEYDTQNTPWNFSIHESFDSPDYCAGSHSCYNPSGASDDWMMTPQIFIPDNLARLTFQAQSYRRSKKDVLQVYIYENEQRLTYLGADDYNRMKANGTKVLEATLSPGADEEGLAGDWQDFEIDLSAYAGKNIYVAFGNENNNQSMIFVDNVKVYRDMPFILSLSTPTAVENQEYADIAGKLVITNDGYTYNTVSLELRDADGNKIDAITMGNEDKTDANTFKFAFAHPLPLVVGEENRYSIDVYLDGTLTSVDYSIKDFVFTPTKHVVLEEMTGQPCGNCPQGILAIEQMEKIYGKQFIPISIHTYDGDPWGGNLTGYTAYLNLNAAPTARVQRMPGILMPMAQTTDGKFTFTNDGTLWMDKVSEEMEQPTEIEVSATVEYDKATGSLEIPVTLRCAINQQNLSLNVFAVVMEDGLVARQKNYFSAYTDPAFGEWGQGGKYGQSVASGVIHNDVVRACLGNSYAGTSGLLPQSMDAGKEYATYRNIRAALPESVENPDNVKVCVMIIDANTDRIINATVAHLDPTKDGITAPSTSASSSDVYNLQGQKVNSTYRGIVIHNGKKYIKL